jgi:hypothetical protein
MNRKKLEAEVEDDQKSSTTSSLDKNIQNVIIANKHGKINLQNRKSYTSYTLFSKCIL